MLYIVLVTAILNLPDTCATNTANGHQAGHVTTEVPLLKQLVQQLSTTVQHLVTKSANSEGELNVLKSQLANQAILLSQAKSKSANSEAGLKLLEDKVANQAILLSQAKSRESLLQKQITDHLNVATRQVAFSARTGDSRAYAPGQTVIFNTEITDVGNNYNPNTGVFVCPYSGTYMFSLAITSGGATHTEATLMIGSQLVGYVLAYAEFHDQGANTVISFCPQNAHVYVNIKKRAGYIHTLWSSFSGVLLFE